MSELPTRYTCDEDSEKMYDTMPPKPGGIGPGTLKRKALAKGYRGETALRSSFADLASGDEGQQARGKFAIMLPADMRSLPEPTWLVAGIIPARSVVLIYGPSGSFKTFILLEILLAIATGRPAFGFAFCAQGGVVFCAGEGPISIARKRFPAWGEAREITNLDAIPFGLIARVPLVGSAEEIDGLIAAIRASDLKPIAVAIDTASRSLAGLDENSAKDTGLLIAALEKLKRELDCAVLIVHHSGKDVDRGARGSSAIEAAVDTVLKVSAERDVLAVTVQCTKQKDADETGPIYLRGRVCGESLVFDRIGDGEFRALTTPADDLSAALVGRALRGMEAIGPRKAATTNALAHEILNLTDKSEDDPGEHQRAVNALGQRLKELARDGSLAGLAVKTGPGKTAAWSWFLADGEAAQ